jgi:hypothetical protein
MTGVSLFSPDRLQQVVRETLPQDDDPRAHVVVGTIDQDGAQVVASFKRNSTSIWELQVAARHEWTGATSVGGKVLLRW